MLSGLVVCLFRRTVSAVFLPYWISTPIAYFSNSATAGPQPGMKKEEGWTTKIILENLEKVLFFNLTWDKFPTLCLLFCIYIDLFWFILSGLVVLFVSENCVSAVFLLYWISTPIAYFSNSATAGPQPGIKKEEGWTTKIILENLEKVGFLTGLN